VCITCHAELFRVQTDGIKYSHENDIVIAKFGSEKVLAA